jgi:predicted GNAT superfamily acetyltransferase
MNDLPRATARDADASDYAVLCAFNHAEVQHTSPMDEARLAALHGLACCLRVACIDGAVSGFLLAMRSGARYENDNFLWFERRYADFVYIDRVVVAQAARGMRVGSLLYEDLFRFARQQGAPLVACEYNVVPANEPSRLFHDRFGFTEVGRQWVAQGSKQVSLQVAAS